MLKDVIINLHSVHSYDTKNADTLDFSTDGFFKIDNGVACITYMESEITGLKGTRTSVFIMPDSVVVDRDGTLTSRMIFKEGEKSSFLYSTPYGQATMGIRTRSISSNIGEEGGNVEIDFVVDVNHAVATRNKLSIEVKNA